MRGVFPVLLLLLLGGATGDDVEHKYKVNEAVHVYGNKVGPFNNPLETYGYFDLLPWCKPQSMESRFPSLGEALAGDELIKLDIDVRFRKSRPRTVICSSQLSEKDADILTKAIDEQYWYQLYADDLPMWAAVGKTEHGKRYVYTHSRFSFGYNNNRIVIANLTVENLHPVAPGENLDWTYSVDWTESDVQFANRFRKYLDESFFEHRIHWFSVCNSFMMVFFLAGLVFAILMRTLNADYDRYARTKDTDEEFEDWGWKRVHTDVFRVPQHTALFCALIGTGHQLITLVFCIIFFAIASVVYTDRGGLLSYAVLAWAITSIVAGYSSGRTFYQYTQEGPGVNAQDWKKTLIYTAFLFPGVVGGLTFLLNFIGVYYNSQQAIPFLTMVIVVCLWGFVAFPLTILGTLAGRHFGKPRTDIPRVSQVPSKIPERWYLYRPFFLSVGGILPFCAIFIELYFVFTSFWNYKFYYVYGFMLLVYVILIIVLMCVAVVSTYLLLNGEDYRWQWTSYLLCASTAGYVFLYSAYFFVFKTKMTGFLMTAYYFTYMFLFCFGFALLCGTVGYSAAELFVTRIYRNLKLD